MTAGTLKRDSLEVDREIGRTIRRLREAQSLSQDALGAALGISFQQIRKYEIGANRVSASALILICKVLRVGPMDIIGKHFDPAP